MRYSLVGLDCPNCAAKIERELRKVKGLEEVTVNFNALRVELPEKLEESARAVIARVPDVKLERIRKERIRCSLDGLDCANCAAKIETGLNKVRGLEDVKVNFATKSVEIPRDFLSGPGKSLPKSNRM